MAKRKARSWIASLTPDHKKSRIDLFPMSDSGVRHGVGKLLALDESYNFASDRIAIRGLLAKLWGSKIPRVPFGAISGLPLGSPGKNSHLDVASVESCRVYYKGEGGGFPQVRAVVSLVCPCCPWLVLAPRVLQLCTNHFVWVVCRLVWVTKAYQLFLVPSRSSNTPLYPSKCCELGSVLRLLLLPLFSYLGSHLSPLRSWECVRFSHCPLGCFKFWFAMWCEFFLIFGLFHSNVED
jgi:hypothetical protein